MILSRAIAETYAVRDFDHLGMPFRAVATDIVTGSPAVLGSGDLALALRASMSLPAVLTPVDIDGRMLVDGGLAMNLPIEVVQAMGADIVVAVDVTSALLARESMRSVIDVTSQLTTLITQPSMQQQKKLLDADDVLLVPAFDADASFTSFAQFKETIGDGYQAVMDERRRFESWSLDAERYSAHVAQRGRPRPAQRPIVSFVRLDNRSSIADSVILARIGDVALGAPLDLPAVEAAVGRVYGLELFQNVRYEVVTDAAGAAGLQIQVEERAWGPSYFQAGVHYVSSSSADSIFALDASYLRTGINPYGGEWRATMSLGDEPGLLADFYQPLGPKAEFFLESQLAGTSSVRPAIIVSGSVVPSCCRATSSGAGSYSRDFRRTRSTASRSRARGRRRRSSGAARAPRASRPTPISSKSCSVRRPRRRGSAIRCWERSVTTRP